MSGLLDKANKAAEESEEVAVVDAVVEDTAPTGFLDAASGNENGLNMDALKFQILSLIHI